MTREERENGENPSRIYRVPLCGHRHNESEKDALIIHRRPNAERPFILSNEQRPRDRGVTLLLAAIQPENIELARGAPLPLSRSDTKTGPMPRSVHPESASDPLSLKLGLDRRPFDSLYSQDRSLSLSLSAEGGTPPPSGSKRNAQGSC